VPTRHTNDIELYVGSTTKRLRLLRQKDKDGNEEAAYYSISEEVPRYAKPLSFVQSDWSGGHGQYAFADETKYMEGACIDTSFPGKVLPASMRNSTSEVYQLVDAAVAADGAALTTETAGAINAVTDDMTLFPAVPAGNDAYYFGRDTSGTSVAVLINISTAFVGVWTVAWEYYDVDTTWKALGSLYDGTVGFTASGYKKVSGTISGTWAQVAVNSITKYWIRCRVVTYTSIATHGHGKQAWFDTGSMSAAPVTSTWYKTTGSYFVATDTKIFEYDATNVRWIERVEFAGKTITNLCEHDSILYVAQGNADKWWYTADGYTYTQTDLTDGYAQKFLVAPNSAGTSDRLWFYQTPNELMNTTDGRTVGGGGAQASTPAYIGDTSYNITNIFLCNDKLMVGKENGLWHYDMVGGQHPLMTELEHNRSTTNFKYVAYYKGSTYFSLIRNCGEVTASDYLSIVGPLKDCDTSIAKVGDIVGMTSDEDFLYVSVDEGTDTHIYKGSQVVGKDGNLHWAWCSILNLLTTTTTLLKMCQSAISGSHLGLLWFSYGNGMGYVDISQNPSAELVSVYSTGSPLHWVRSSYFYGSNPYWDKIWQSVVVETANCTASDRIYLAYRDDADTTSTTIVASFYTNGVQELKLSSALTNKRIAIEIIFDIDAHVTTPPEVRYLELKGIEVPEVTKLHTCTFEVGDEPEIRAKTIMDYLDTARASTSLIKFADLRRGMLTSDTTYKWVVVEPGYPRFTEVTHENSRHPEYAVECVFREVDYTVS
jgi:hypothetical protein